MNSGTPKGPAPQRSAASAGSASNPAAGGSSPAADTAAITATDSGSSPGAGDETPSNDKTLSIDKTLSSDVATLFQQAREGNRRSLGRLLSYTERGGARADAVAVATWPLAGNAHVVGITGAPGVGKSTLTDQLAQAATDNDQRVAILAVDPSSPLTGGAILGDRVRMQSAATPEGPFVRSMASRGQSGGLALAALAAVRLLDATGHDLILVETVGIGQVEMDIARTADTTIVAVSPGWGDAVQANKAGLLEMADIFVVNKADRAGAADARRDLEYMLDLGHRSGWRPPVTLTVATTGDGLGELFEHLQAHRHHLHACGVEADRRARHVAEEVRRHLHRWVDLLVDQPSANADELFARVMAGHLAPADAARQLSAELGPLDGLPNSGNPAMSTRPAVGVE